MNGQKINESSSPSTSPSTSSSSSDQLPAPTTINTAPDPAIQHVGPNTEEKQHYAKKIKRRGVTCLIFGIIVLIGLFLPLIVFAKDSNSPAAGAIVYLLYAPIYMCIRIGGTIACIVLLILTLVDMKRYKIKLSKYLIVGIVGFALTFSPYIFSGIRKAAITSDPFKITAGSMSISDCWSSATRASNKNWSDVNSLGNNPDSIAEDIACSYLEYFYDNDKEPSSSAQLSQYYQSYNAKNGIATITINAEQPDKTNIYNVITHRSCAYDDTNNDSAISVWFRVEKENNGIGCVDVTAKNYSNNETQYLNLYDLEQSKEWLEYQFKVELSSNEAQELIENQRKTSNDNTWTTGTVKIDSKSREGYYWVVYEKIINGSTKTEENALFHRENGTWVFEPLDHNYVNTHSFKRITF